MIKIFECILLLLLLITGIAAPLQKNSILTVIVFTTFGLVMSVVWMMLQAPDLAITEAAVGAGVTGVLFYLTLRRCGESKRTEDEE
jgi:uncharacterized MnhB-related membrane protein